MSDDTELAAQRRARTTEGLGLFAPPEPERHEAAQRSVEASATPHETRIVERVKALMVARGQFSADDVSRALDDEGVPETLEIRRRYASRVTNGIRNKVATGKVMTTLGKRSGREVTMWLIIPPLDNG